MLRRFLADELVDHVEYAVQRAGGIARRVTEFGQRVIGAIQVRRTVDQDQVGIGHIGMLVSAVLVGLFFLIFAIGPGGSGWLLDLARIAREI